MNGGRYHWSNLAREVQFVAVNWVAAIPWGLLIFYQSWSLVIFATLLTVVLLYVRFVAKMTLEAAARAILSLIAGRQKATNNWFRVFIRQR